MSLSQKSGQIRKIKAESGGFFVGFLGGIQERKQFSEISWPLVAFG